MSSRSEISAREVYDRLVADPDLEIGLLSADEVAALGASGAPAWIASVRRRSRNGKGGWVYSDLEDVSHERMRRKIERMRSEGWGVDSGPEPVAGNVVAGGEFFPWEGAYVKGFYDVRVGGEVVPCCPNAGVMDAVDGSGRRFRPEDGVEARLVELL